MSKLKPYEKPSIIVCAILPMTLNSASGESPSLSFELDDKNAIDNNDDYTPYAKQNNLWTDD